MEELGRREAAVTRPALSDGLEGVRSLVEDLEGIAGLDGAAGEDDRHDASEAFEAVGVSAEAGALEAGVELVELGAGVS